MPPCATHWECSARLGLSKDHYRGLAKNAHALFVLGVP